MIYLLKQWAGLPESIGKDWLCIPKWALDTICEGRCLVELVEIRDNLYSRARTNSPIPVPVQRFRVGYHKQGRVTVDPGYGVAPLMQDVCLVRISYLPERTGDRTMATQDVPGANPKNADRLDDGCWAEDKDDSSLVLVIGREGGSVVYQLYDLAEDPPFYYQDAMLEKDFKEFFSAPPTGSSDVEWMWHDKTSFPWNRVMKRFSGKTPQYADVADQLSVAQKVARKLGLRGKKLSEQDVTPLTEQQRTRGMEVIEKIAEAIGSLRN